MENDDTKFNGLHLTEREELTTLLEKPLGEATDDDIRRYNQLIRKTVRASYKRVKRIVREW